MALIRVKQMSRESAQDAAGRPWDEQVQDAYTTLANQRGIPVASR